MNISDKTMGAMQNSDPEVQKMMLESQQNNNQTISEPVNKPGFFERLLNYAFGAGASEPDSMTMSNVGTGFNTVLDSSGNIQIVPVQTNNNFPFISMAEFAKNNNMISPATVVPNTQSGFATNFPTQPVKSGITQSTVGQTFEAPFVMSGNQKFAIDDPLIAERSNYVQKPTGIMTQAKDFFTQTVPKIASSAIDFIPGMRFIKSLDRFDSLPYQDRKFIESVMQKDAKGNLTPGIYVDPSTGLLKDMRGKNVRSLMGNYAESIENDYAKKEQSIQKSKDKWEEKFGSLGNTNEYGKTWNEMNKRNVAEFNFLTQMKNKFDKQKADLKEKIKKTKSVNIHGGPTFKGGDNEGFNQAAYDAGKASAAAQEKSMRDYARGKFD